MAQDLALANPATALSNLPTSLPLNTALEPTIEPIYAADGEFSERTTWTTPAEISADLRDDARRQLAALEPLLRPARSDDLRAWLVSLGLLTAGRKETGDARARVGAYVSTLAGDVAAGVVTRDSLAKAGRRFQWWPSVYELAAFFDGEAVSLKVRAGRLRAIINGTDREPEGDPWDGPRTLSQATQDAIAKLRADTPGWQHGSPMTTRTP